MISIDVRFKGKTGRKRYTFPFVPPIHSNILLDGTWHIVTHVAFEEITYYVRQGESDFEYYIVVENQETNYV